MDTLPPPPAPYVGRPKQNVKATWSLILSLVGVMFVFASIAALVLGYQAKREIDRSRGMEKGDGQAGAGIAIGWFVIGCWILFLATGGFSLMLEEM